MACRGGAESAGGRRQVCRYGKKCYRKNPEHHKEFAHPWLDDEEGPPSGKRPRLEQAGSSKDVAITLSPGSHSSQSPDSAPFTLSPHSLFYLTHVTGIASRYNSHDTAIGIKDILSPVMGEIVCSAQFNYLVDIPWLMDQYPPACRNCPLLVVHGDQNDAGMKKAAQPHPNIAFCRAKLPIMFGTHHSKMMLLVYREGLRVVIHTANLIAKDWEQKTQGVWVSPLFPPMSQETAEREGETSFKQDLLEYLSAYGAKGLDEWKQRIAAHNLSSARVHLIASVPGAHTGREMNKWGHLKLKKVLSTHCSLPHRATPSQWPVVGQFSSVGSLGPSPSQWLTSEWLSSLSSSSSSSSSFSCETKLKPSTTPQKLPPLKLVFPTVENVGTSLEGYMAGGSIPYASQTAAKQPYLRDFLHQWKAEGTGRSRAAPHIKTYMRVSPDEREVAWTLLTSSNLSKAAWGALEKKGSQLKIRSYEIGVLFLPQDRSTTATPQDRSTTATSSSRATFSVGGGFGSVPGLGMGLTTPFDLPLTPYTREDQPWVWNARHMKPDSKGNVWTPPS